MEQQELLSVLAATKTPIWKKLTVESSIPERLHFLKILSKNLWWVWNYEAEELFKLIDEETWEKVNHNPIELLANVSLERFIKLENDNTFIHRMDTVQAMFNKYCEQRKDPSGPKIAYFSMEYGLHSTLKIYSGGLGVLAGDFMKEASDKNINMVAVGLLYRYGYFTQIISSSGEQQAHYEASLFHKIPVSHTTDSEGNWLIVDVDLPGRKLYLRVWEVYIGSIKLYLLDADFDANQEYDRFVTHHLYGGDNENRIKQEIVLGIGGIKTLQALGVEADIYHCNEGHAAFLGIERLKCFVQNKNLPFNVAKELVRSSTLFTTHTPVPAGHDSFNMELFNHYMGHYANELGLNQTEFEMLGKSNTYDDHFNMSYLASNCSMLINGVSKIHGEVSRDLLNNLYSGYLSNELENIGYVTNGVHYPTWSSHIWKELYDDSLVKEASIGIDAYDINKETQRWKDVYKISDRRIWDAKQKLKQNMIDFVKSRYRSNFIQRHESPKFISEALSKLDPKILTIGFGRRFATYKRAHLLFKNLERLNRIVNNPERPVHFLFMGKAHPADKQGQDLIKNIVEVSKRPEFIGKILFIQNYDMRVANVLLQGVDVWMNTPTRPLEASGTSGEKGIMNGTLHLSVLDGWWGEGYREGAGWALSQEKSFDDQYLQDDLDAEIIYDLFEKEIVPNYYEKNSEGVPTAWIDSIKQTFAEIVPNFTTSRMMKDYYDQYYIPMQKRYNNLKANNLRLATEIAEWKEKIIRNWDAIEVVKSAMNETQTSTYEMGRDYPSQVGLDLKELKKEEVGIELVIATIDTVPKLIDTFDFIPTKEENGIAYYSLEINLNKPGSYNYGIRIYPKHKELPHKIDFGLMKWL